MAETPEDYVTSFLQTFLDFVYAAVFAFLVQQTYERVILGVSDPNEALCLGVVPLTREMKLTRLLLAGGVFYFLMTDYLQARLLISRNTFRGYRRFFISLLIAVLDFGAAIEVMRADIFFLVYIVLVLVFGFFWAHCALQEYPNSSDKTELRAIRVVQPLVAVVGSLIVYLWSRYIGDVISLYGAIFLLILGLLYEFSYDLFAIRKRGIEGGPLIPLITRERMDRIRRYFKIS